MRFFDSIIKWFDDYFSLDDKKVINDLNNTISNLNNDYDGLYNKLLSSQDEVIELKRVIDDMNKTLLIAKNNNDLEYYWNNIRRKANITYPARPALRKSCNIKVDPRIFSALFYGVPLVSGDNNDVKVINALKYVIKNIKYSPDDKTVNLVEAWMFPFETLNLGLGDCEDMAILTHAVLLASGVPYWRLRLNTGSVEYGSGSQGHCWLTYLRESDNKWYIIDPAYYPKDSLKWLSWDVAERYFSVWWSFNRDYVFKGGKREDVYLPKMED